MMDEDRCYCNATNAPCGFCESLTESEVELMDIKGIEAVYAQRDLCDSVYILDGFNLTPWLDRFNSSCKLFMKITGCPIDGNTYMPLGIGCQSSVIPVQSIPDSPIRYMEVGGVVMFWEDKQ